MRTFLVFPESQRIDPPPLFIPIITEQYFQFGSGVRREDRWFLPLKGNEYRRRSRGGAEAPLEVFLD